MYFHVVFCSFCFCFVLFSSSLAGFMGFLLNDDVRAETPQGGRSLVVIIGFYFDCVNSLRILRIYCIIKPRK